MQDPLSGYTLRIMTYWGAAKSYKEILYKWEQDNNINLFFKKNNYGFGDQLSS
jgi:hypothetical protein